MRKQIWKREISLRWFLIAFTLLLWGCDFQDRIAGLAGDDLTMAKKAHLNRDWPLAERLLGRYLREEQDSEKRWEAWQLLLEALNSPKPEPRASLECLEVMLMEYQEDEARLAEILAAMGKYNEALRHYDKAANAWSAYVELGILESEVKVNGLRKLAHAQFSQRLFDAAEETLQQCLALPLPDSKKTWCMLDLADASMSKGEFQETADLCQQILDSEPDTQIMGQAAWLRGDALEQLGDLRGALSQFEQGRESYPNPAVMDNRIEWLKNQLKLK